MNAALDCSKAENGILNLDTNYAASSAAFNGKKAYRENYEPTRKQLELKANG
jgi:hypothetical protein